MFQTTYMQDSSEDQSLRNVSTKDGQLLVDEEVYFIARCIFCFQLHGYEEVMKVHLSISLAACD